MIADHIFGGKKIGVNKEKNIVIFCIDKTTLDPV